MYIFKNALKSITRTKARNILIGIIIVIISISSCVALCIKDAANELINSYKESYDVTAELTLNRESMRQDAKSNTPDRDSFNPQEFMNNVPELTVSMLEEYGDSIYVKDFEYSVQVGLNGVKITKVTMEQKNSKMSEGMGDRGESLDFTLIGYNSLDAMTDFISGNYKITDGKIFEIDSTDNSCVITNELAEENELKVGDTITLSNPKNEEEKYELKIAGIYEDSSDSGEFSMFSKAANQILTTYNTVNEIVKNSEVSSDTKLNMQTTNRFNLTSSDVVDNFKEELDNKGLSNYYTLKTNIDSVEEALTPLNNLSNFAGVFLIIVLIVGGSILVIINMLNIRERKYEIGVLRAIGMKKNKVLGQFLIEILIVTMIAIIIGTVIGSFLTVPTANFMLKSQIEDVKDKQSSINSNFGREQDGGIGRDNNDMLDKLGNTDTNFLTQMNATINGKTILGVIGIGLLLSVISGSVSMIFISRYTPLKILSSRT